MTDTTLTRRGLLAAMPALAFIPVSSTLSPSMSQGRSVENDLDTFLQSLRQLDDEGRAWMVKFLRDQDNKIFNALANPVEHYCANPSAADIEGMM